jgi:TolB-like protein
MNLHNFFAELKRRNVYKVAVAYAVGAWLLIQAASILFPAFDAPASAIKILVIVLVLGFPISLAFSWAFEITPEGIKRESEVESGKSIAHHTGRKIVAITVALAIIAAGLFTYQILRPKSLAPRPSEAATDVPQKSIAVLPFENLSEEKQNEYFADGVQDEILTNLAKVADLKVISRTSVIGYRDTAGRNLRKIGQELGVAHLVEGSVQRSANKIRVNAQLIDARTDAHLWAQTYDRDLADVFAIQSEIAKAIADQLQAKLSPNEKKAIEQPPTTDLAAFDLYSRAKSLLLTAAFAAINEPGVRKAIELLDEAVKRDPSFFDAYCQLAYAHETLYGVSGFDHTAARLALAEAALQAATRLRPDAGETHLARANYLYYGRRDWPAHWPSWRARAGPYRMIRVSSNLPATFYAAAASRKKVCAIYSARRSLTRVTFLLCNRSRSVINGWGVMPRPSLR